MPQADSNRLKIYVSPETTWGETPSGPAMKELRATGETLTHEKATIRSNEIRSDRMVADVVEVGRGASGDISGELTFGTFSSLFEGALMGGFTASTVVANSATFAASVITLGGAASHSAAALASGAWIRVSTPSGTSNGGLYKVGAAGASSITIVGGATMSAVAGQSVNISWNYARNGTTEKSYLIEKSFGDVTEFVWFNGMEVNQMTLQAQAQAITTLGFSFTGKQGNTMSAVTIGSAITSANSNSPMNATGNVSAVFEGGSAIGISVRSVNLQVANNLRAQSAFGNAPPIGVGLGTCEVTGSLEAYFENEGLYNKFRSHTGSSLTFRFTDALGQSVVFTVPALYFTSGTPQAGGLDQDVFVNLNFTGYRFPDHNAVIQIDSV